MRLIHAFAKRALKIHLYQIVKLAARLESMFQEGGEQRPRRQRAG
jgi:hypothetical protein